MAPPGGTVRNPPEEDAVLTTTTPIAFLPSSDLERSRHFYAGVLGLTLEEVTPFAVVLRAGPIMLRVTEAGSFRPQPFTVFGWQVADLRAEAARLRSAGVSLTVYDGMGQDDDGIWTTPGGDRVTWFSDPDGNTLSLTEFTGSHQLQS